MASEVGLAIMQVRGNNLVDFRITRRIVKRMGNRVGNVTRMQLRKYDSDLFPVVVAYRAVGTLKGKA